MPARCNEARHVATQRTTLQRSAARCNTAGHRSFPARSGFGDGRPFGSALLHAVLFVCVFVCSTGTTTGKALLEAQATADSPRFRLPRPRVALLCAARRSSCLVSALSAQCSVLQHVATQRAQCNMLQHSERTRSRRAIAALPSGSFHRNEQTNRRVRERHSSLRASGAALRPVLECAHLHRAPVSTREHPWVSGWVGEYA